MNEFKIKPISALGQARQLITPAPPACLALTHAGIENRIYIRGELTRKKCKTAILLYCFHTACVPHIFALNNIWGPGTSF